MKFKDSLELAREISIDLQLYDVVMTDRQIEALIRRIDAVIREVRLDEARWWQRQIESRLIGRAFYRSDTSKIAYEVENKRIAELEKP